MRKYTEPADEYARPVASDRQPENRVRMHVDARGYAIMTRGWYGMEFLGRGETSQFKDFIDAGVNLNRLPTADIILPHDWTWVVVGDELVAVRLSEWAREQQALTGRAAA